MATSEERIWLYLDQNRAQRGPFPSSVLERLLAKGLAGISAQTMVWKQGFEHWKPMATVPEFEQSCQFHSTQWYYVSTEGETKGPVATRFLLHKMKDGALSLTHLVYRQEGEGWRKIEDIPDLQQEYRKVQTEREQQEQLNSVKETQEQVFNPEDVFEAIPELEVAPPAKENKADSSKETGEGTVSEAGTKGKKSFVADNGVKYKWDVEEDCWVMDDSDGEDDEDKLKDEDTTSQDGVGNKRNREEDDGEDDEVEDDNKAEKENKPKKRRSKKKKKLPNTWVYITGLPANVTVEEIKDHFSKVGLIAISPYDQQPRIKIYKDEHNPDVCKGDGSLCYNAEESVQLALDILDGGYIRPNFQITVTKANFEYSQGNADGSAARKPTLTQAQIKVARNASRQALAWNVDEDIGVSKSSALRIIVLEGMFHPSDFQDPSFEKELEDDVAMECGKLGDIEKMTIFSKNPRGVVVLKYATASAAQECIRLMNGRYFGKIKIKCYYWDGITNFSMTANHDEEEEKEEEERLHALGDWLEHEQEELPEEFMLRTE